MRVMTILGTRPEIIRLSRIIPLLDENTDHVLVHTGQNYDHNLSAVFFEEMGLRAPDVFMNIKGVGFGEQVGQILAGSETLIREHAPDKLLLLGDTNSATSAYIAKRIGTPVYHMEAGNRCYDDRVPEEINRRVIDHSSDILLPYTYNSAENLALEGIEKDRIVITGNPIFEVIGAYKDRIRDSRICESLSLEPKGFALVTLHRSENVDVENRLRAFIDSLVRVNVELGMPVIISTHPRMRDKMQHFGIGGDVPSGLRFLGPFGFFDFIALEQSAACVLTDSGTVQEECCILQVPNLTLRDVTERPETVQCGSNVLTGANPDRIVEEVQKALSGSCDWDVPPEYLVPDVSLRILDALHAPLPDPMRRMRAAMNRFNISGPLCGHLESGE
jgi:UDP-N-acetylglucosamine 2-epimerase (non-hydrolysing)